MPSLPPRLHGVRLALGIGMMRMGLSAVFLVATMHAFGPFSSSMGGAATAKDAKDENDPRAAAIARAQVWTPGRVASRDIKTGPAGPGAFKFHATVECEYSPEDLSGASPKFACIAGKDDELKVKYGGDNAEVYAEVAATRLLWALGFGADRMYPVRVICHGCPPMPSGIARDDGKAWIFDPATVERKMDGREFPKESGWGWTELDQIDEEAGGAPRAHRDALKLLAVFLQHTDTKPQQQRLMCLEGGPAKANKSKPARKSATAEETRCAQPFMMVSDVGLTFGRANTFNANHRAMNLVEWSRTPVWKDAPGCVGNLPKSFTGTLAQPVISEGGRRFLANLLTQLSDAQIRDLFEVSRVTLRLRDPENARSGFSTVAEWTDAFKDKRRQIVEKRCA